MNNFTKKVYDVVKMIPDGYVASYGQIAAIAGNSHAARAVGNILHVNPDPIETPCYKIVNAKGKLSPNYGFGGIEEQKRRLENSGVKVINYHVDLSKYQWDKWN